MAENPPHDGVVTRASRRGQGQRVGFAERFARVTTLDGSGDQDSSDAGAGSLRGRNAVEIDRAVRDARRREKVGRFSEHGRLSRTHRAGNHQDGHRLCGA
jgi:hypothetical protein